MIKKKTVFQNIRYLFSENKKESLHALNRVNLEIKKGETIGLIGNNGSGKTTLLSVIANIISPDDGTCTVEGKVLPLFGLGVGFEKELTGKDNAYLYGSILGMRNREIDLRFDEIMEFADIERFVETKMKNFSAGMMARLAFSIAIMAPFDILIIDEVLEVGDKSFIDKSFEKLKGFREEGKTIVLASHDYSLIRRVCEKTIWLSKGGVKGFDKTKKIFDLYLESTA